MQNPPNHPRDPDRRTASNAENCSGKRSIVETSLRIRPVQRTEQAQLARSWSSGSWQTIWTGALLWVLTLNGCHWLHNSPTLPSDHEIRRGPLRVHCDQAFPEYDLLIAGLSDLHVEVARRLQLPLSDREVHVYLFDKAKRFDKYIAKTHPGFPDRRAFFVRDGESLIVYAQWGDRVAEDLRHELTHAYLNATTESIPLWLDEGLAEYFERPATDNGLHPGHIELLQARWQEGSWQPNLRQLEGLSSSGQMQLIDYAEAWLWVHWMLEQDPAQRTHLSDYLNQSPEYRLQHPFSETLPGGDSASVALAHHLEHLMELNARIADNESR